MRGQRPTAPIRHRGFHDCARTRRLSRTCPRRRAAQAADPVRRWPPLGDLTKGSLSTSAVSATSRPPSDVADGGRFRRPCVFVPPRRSSNSTSWSSTSSTGRLMPPGGPPASRRWTTGWTASVTVPTACALTRPFTCPRKDSNLRTRFRKRFPTVRNGPSPSRLVAVSRAFGLLTVPIDPFWSKFVWPVVLPRRYHAPSHAGRQLLRLAVVTWVATAANRR